MKESMETSGRNSGNVSSRQRGVRVEEEGGGKGGRRSRKDRRRERGRNNKRK